MDRIRLGIIGCGYWGPNLIRNFIEFPESELVVVADLKRERLEPIQKRYPQVVVTENYQELLNMKLDAVVIATPPKTHYAIAEVAINRGLHVFVEKPITLCSSDAERLIELAAAYDRILMVGHTFEYNAAVHTLKNLIESGELGQIYYLDSARLNLGLFQSDLNVLWDLAPHDVSILMYLLGKAPLSVSARGAACVFRDIVDVVYINLIFPDNITAHIHVSWLDPCKVRRVTAVGSKKMAVYNDVESLEKIKIYDKGVDHPKSPMNYGEFQCSYRYGDVLIPNIHFVEPLRVECQHFLDSIITHTQPCSCGKDGLDVVRVLEAAQRSLLNRGHQENCI